MAPKAKKTPKLPLPQDGDEPEMCSPSSAPLGMLKDPKHRMRSLVHVCTHGTCLAQGAKAVLADIEELGARCGVAGVGRGCMNFCGQGPNAIVEVSDAPDEVAFAPTEQDLADDVVDGNGKQVIKGIETFDAVLELLSTAMSGDAHGVPEDLLARRRLRSDAARLLSLDMARPSDEILADMDKADTSLTEGLAMEGDAKDSDSAERRRDLRTLRGKARSRCVQCCPRENRAGHVDNALEDFSALTAENPHHAPTYFEIGRLFSFAGRLQESVDAYKRAYSISTNKASLPSDCLSADEVDTVSRTIERLEKRIEQGGDLADDCGEFDGAGRWLVEEIVGVSWDTCIYRLKAPRVPTEPHKFPHDAWHVSCGFSGTMREYTPMSTAKEWAEGRLDILLKTYVDGIVSSEFGRLLTFQEAEQESKENFTPIEDQNCWVWVTKPEITIFLPACLDTKPSQTPPVITKIGVIVGGTGIAPALQLLREVADPEGAFGTTGKAIMLLSSHTVLDVLCLNELREIELQAEGRVSTHHTLTAQTKPIPKKARDPDDIDMDEEEEEEEEDPWDEAPLLMLDSKHDYFASMFKPFEPDEGYIGQADVDNPVLYGRVSEKMIVDLMPSPGDDVRIITCGPPGMQMAVKKILFNKGFGPKHLVELAGTIGQTNRPTTAEEAEQARPADTKLVEESPAEPANIRVDKDVVDANETVGGDEPIKAEAPSGFGLGSLFNFGCSF